MPGRARVRRPRARLGRVRVVGRSMQPTLYDGDLLLVQWGGRPAAGRLVVLRLPDRPLSVKRVAWQEPEGWWVERDNPREGVDSWSVGAVPDGDVVGRVLVRYWPVGRRTRLSAVRRSQRGSAARRRAR